MTPKPETALRLGSRITCPVEGWSGRVLRLIRRPRGLVAEVEIPTGDRYPAYRTWIVKLYRYECCPN